MAVAVRCSLTVLINQRLLLFIGALFITNWYLKVFESSGIHLSEIIIFVKMEVENVAATAATTTNTTTITNESEVNSESKEESAIVEGVKSKLNDSGDGGTLVSSAIINEEESAQEGVGTKTMPISTGKTSPAARKMKSSPEHRERLLAQLARGRETARRNRESGTFILPLRNIKRIMRLNEDVGMVQNEAAILVQAAAELFTKQFAVDSLSTAKSNGRKNTIKYEDVAETRSSKERLSFLEPLLP